MLIKDIKDTWLSSQIEDIKDKLGAVFKACSKTTKDKADKVDKTKLLELSAKEVTRIGLFVTDLINQVSQLLRAELEELVDMARTTIEPIKPCDKEW